MRPGISLFVFAFVVDSSNFCLAHSCLAISTSLIAVADPGNLLLPIHSTLLHLSGYSTEDSYKE